MSTRVSSVSTRQRASRNNRPWKKRLALSLASLVFVGSSIVAAGAPASAAVVPNFYECNPATGWCYQTNPPHQPSLPRACRWNYNATNTTGMWFQNCTPGYWRPEVH